MHIYIYVCRVRLLSPLSTRSVFASTEQKENIYFGRIIKPRGDTNRGRTVLLKSPVRVNPVYTSPQRPRIHQQKRSLQNAKNLLDSVCIYGMIMSVCEMWVEVRACIRMVVCACFTDDCGVIDNVLPPPKGLYHSRGVRWVQKESSLPDIEVTRHLGEGDRSQDNTGKDRIEWRFSCWLD